MFADDDVSFDELGFTFETRGGEFTIAPLSGSLLRVACTRKRGFHIAAKMAEFGRPMRLLFDDDQPGHVVFEWHLGDAVLVDRSLDILSSLRIGPAASDSNKADGS